MQGNQYAAMAAQEAKDMGAVRAHPVGTNYTRAEFEHQADARAFVALAKECLWYVLTARAHAFSVIVKVRLDN